MSETLRIKIYENLKHGCCGWYNVFDYCDQASVSSIMYSVINGDSLAEFENPNSAFDSYDDYGSLSSNYEAYSDNRKAENQL